MKTPTEIAHEIAGNVCGSCVDDLKSLITQAIEAERDVLAKKQKLFDENQIHAGDIIADLRSKLTESTHATQELKKQLEESQLERVRLERALENFVRDADNCNIEHRDHKHVACDWVCENVQDARFVLSNPTPNKIRDEIKAAERVIRKSKEFYQWLDENMIFISNKELIDELCESFAEYDAIRGK